MKGSRPMCAKLDVVEFYGLGYPKYCRYCMLMTVHCICFEVDIFFHDVRFIPRRTEL